MLELDQIDCYYCSLAKQALSAIVHGTVDYWQPAPNLSLSFSLFLL